MNQELRPSANRRFTFAFDGAKVFVYAVKVSATFGPYSQIRRGDDRGGQIESCIPSKWLWRTHHEAFMAGKRYLKHKGIFGKVPGTGNAFARSNESVCGAGSKPAIARYVLRGTTSGCFDGRLAANATLYAMKGERSLKHSTKVGDA